MSSGQRWASSLPACLPACGHLGRLQRAGWAPFCLAAKHACTALFRCCAAATRPPTHSISKVTTAAAAAVLQPYAEERMEPDTQGRVDVDHGLATAPVIPHEVLEKQQDSERDAD